MAKPSPVQLLVLRAADTDWDQVGRLGGSADLPLCDTGRAAFRVLLDTLTDPSGVPLGPDTFAAVLSGPDDATLECAREVSERFGGKVRKVPGIAEMDLGLWEGLRSEELEEKFPKKHKQWIEQPSSVSIPEGETLDEAGDRIVSELARALDKSKPDARVAVVLRPIAAGLVRRWIEQDSVSSFWESVEAARGSAWFPMDKERLRGGKARTRTSA